MAVIETPKELWQRIQKIGAKSGICLDLVKLDSSLAPPAVESNSEGFPTFTYKDLHEASSAVVNGACISTFADHTSDSVQFPASFTATKPASVTIWNLSDAIPLTILSPSGNVITKIPCNSYSKIELADASLETYYISNVKAIAVENDRVFGPQCVTIGPVNVNVAAFPVDATTGMVTNYLKTNASIASDGDLEQIIVNHNQNVLVLPVRGATDLYYVGFAVHNNDKVINCGAKFYNSFFDTTLGTNPDWATFKAVHVLSVLRLDKTTKTFTVEATATLPYISASTTTTATLATYVLARIGTNHLLTAYFHPGSTYLSGIYYDRTNKTFISVLGINKGSSSGVGYKMIENYSSTNTYPGYLAESKLACPPNNANTINIVESATDPNRVYYFASHILGNVITNKGCVSRYCELIAGKENSAYAWLYDYEWGGNNTSFYYINKIRSVPTDCALYGSNDITKMDIVPFFYGTKLTTALRATRFYYWAVNTATVGIHANITRGYIKSGFYYYYNVGDDLEWVRSGILAKMFVIAGRTYFFEMINDKMAICVMPVTTVTASGNFQSILVGQVHDIPSRQTSRSCAVYHTPGTDYIVIFMVTSGGVLYKYVMKDITPTSLTFLSGSTTINENKDSKEAVNDGFKINNAYFTKEEELLCLGTYIAGELSDYTQDELNRLFRGSNMLRTLKIDTTPQVEDICSYRGSITIPSAVGTHLYEDYMVPLTKDESTNTEILAYFGTGIGNATGNIIEVEAVATTVEHLPR